MRHLPLTLLLLAAPISLGACGSELPSTSQAQTGRLTVTSPTPGATLTLTAEGGGVTTLTSGQAVNLPAGRYTLSVSAAGYAPSTQKVALEAGGVADLTVTLSATPPADTSPTPRITAISDADGKLPLSGVLTVTVALGNRPGDDVTGAALLIGGQVVTTGTINPAAGTATFLLDTAPKGVPAYPNGALALTVRLGTAAGKSAEVSQTVTLQNASSYTPLVSGKSAQNDKDLYFGGGPITINLQPSGASSGAAQNVTWAISAGEISGSGLSATIPYSDANKVALKGDLIRVTATVQEAGGVTSTQTVSLRADDAPPAASGGVTVTRPGQADAFLAPGAELSGATTFQAKFTDAGVGLGEASLSAWRGDVPVQDNLSQAAQLPEAGGYTLRAGIIADRLGNRVNLSATDLAGPFGVDLTAPTVSASVAAGSAIGDADTVRFTATDPQKPDGAPGSGVAALTGPVGTGSGAAFTVTGAQLRAAGAVNGPVAIKVNATDAAGNLRAFTLNVVLK